MDSTQDKEPNYPQLEHNLGIYQGEAASSAQHLRELYENDYLKDLSRRLSEHRKSSATYTHDQDCEALYDHLQRYEAAHEAVQQSRLAVFHLQQKAKEYASKLWVVQSKSEVAKASCGDGATISHTYRFQYGHHEPDIATKLKKALGRLFKQRSKTLVRTQYEETSARLWIQDHIAALLNNVVWEQETGKERGPKTGNTSNTHDLERLRHFLDILFLFERNVRRQPDFDAATEEQESGPTNLNRSSSLPLLDNQAEADPDNSQRNSIIRSLQDWISLLAGTLLQYGRNIDYEYLAIQVLRSRQVARWATCFIQCNVPVVWSSAFQDFYITQLQLVLCGTSPPNPRFASNRESFSNTNADAELALGSNLDEDDYLAILDQMDVPLFFHRLLIEHKEMHIRNGTLYQTELAERTAIRLLAATRHIFDVVIFGLSRLIRFPVLSKRISQMLCQLSQILGDNLLVLGPMASSLQVSKTSFPISLGRDKVTTTQQELDDILRGVVEALLALPGHGLWTFIPSIPFKFMSSSTIASLVEYIALDDIQQWIVDPLALLAMPIDSNKLRHLLGRNPGEAVFLLTALATMVISRSPVRISTELTGFPSLDHRIALIVAFLLLDVAFLDSDIRGELSKPVREVLGSLCDSDPGVIPFMLRFVDRNFKEMGDMAQYLFRELSLDEWEISGEDFSILKKFLETPPLNCPQSMFARFIFGSLSWGTEERSSDDENAVRAPCVFRKELALTMADISIHHIHSFHAESEAASAQTDKELIKADSPTSSSRTKTHDLKFVPTFASSLPQAFTHLAAHSGLHRSVEQTTLRAFMGWCWTMLVRLDLTQIPVLSLVEASRLHVPDPGLAKYPLFSQGQLTFVNTAHLLMTQASRDPEMFLQEGWTTLTDVLHTGMGSALLELTGKLAPRVILSGSDLGPHTTRFGQLLRDMSAWKQDPMLAGAGAQLVEQHALHPFKVPKNLLGFWYLLHVHLQECRSDTSSGVTVPKQVIQFWLSAVFSHKEWMAHQEYVQILDVVCLYCFDIGLDTFIKDVLTEQQILLSIGFRRAPGVSAELMGLAQPGLDRVMDMLPDRFLKALPVPQGSNDPSLLMGTWSVKSFASNLLTQQAMVETSSIWFAYYALLVETQLEKDMRIKIGNYYRQHPADLKTHGNIKAVMKTLNTTSRKTLHNFAIWRWAQHLLILPFDTFLLPLFWQQFFSLYFGHVEQRDVFYGYKFLETHPEMVGQLRDRLQKTYTFFGQEARKEVQNLSPSKAAPLTTLHEFYIALYGWISEPLLLTAEIDLRRIRKDLMSDRLVTCRLPDPLECNSDLWRDLLAERSEATALIQSTPSPSTPPNSSGSASSSTPRASPTSGSPHVRSKNSEQSRAVRMHSRAWQEQKISNCLVKQSRPPPDHFVPRRLVSLKALDLKTSPLNLFSQATRAIRDYCKNYRDTNVFYENLDTSYLAGLGTLYHNEVKTSRLEIACDTTPNALCKRPAMIELKYEEIVLNESVKQSIIENRTRAQSSKLGSVDHGLCLATLEVTKTIDMLLQRLSKDSNDDPAITTKLEELCIESFYFLSKELLEDARVYPPTYLVLTMVVETLGMGVVAKDPRQTESILDLMSTDDFAIALMHRTFYPAALPSEFVRIYQRIATCKEYGLASKDLLLRQFNVQAWACNPTRHADGGGEREVVRKERSSIKDMIKEEDGPSVLDRLAFYEVAFTAMVAQQQLQKQDDQIQEATELSTRDRLAIIKSHRELAGTLFLNFLKQDYVEYLRILFDTCGIMCLEPEVLEDFIRILGVDPRLVPALLDGEDISMDEALSRTGSKVVVRIGLSDYDLECLVQFLADYFTECQDQMVRGNLLDRYNGYAISIASLLTVVLCDERYLTRWTKSSSQIGRFSTPNFLDHQQQGEQSRFEAVNPSQCRMWHDTLMIFQPWLSCLTDRAVDEIHFERQQSGASRMLFTFVGIVSKMMGVLQTQFRDVNPMLVAVFNSWLDLLAQGTTGQGGINQIMLVHQHFRRLEWKGLELSKEHVERILELQNKLSTEIQIEFWTYLVTVVMEKADSDLRPSLLKNSKGTVEWHQTEAAFLRLGLTILQSVDLVAGNDLDLRQQFLDRLWTVIFDTDDWMLLSSEEFRNQVEALKVHWDRAGPWDNLSSPMGLLLYWMRIAVGLESTNLNELDSNGDSIHGEEENNIDAVNQGIDLDVDRVLVYFGYVLRLLQARLASSAEDSQNKNFRMDAIPLVITHLGQVLDRIAGNRFQTKHPAIHRPLLLLVGVLNQCGKGSLSPISSSLPLGYQSFDVVLRGLRRMISEVEIIQLDLVKVVCQRLNSIPAMIRLLEEAIEREFDLWDGQQGSSESLRSNTVVDMASASVFGLEDLSLQPMMTSPMSSIGELEPLQKHYRSSSSGGRRRTATTGGRGSWDKIKAQIETPELSEDEFLEQALGQGAILTIYGRFLQRLEECEQSQDFDEVLELGQELAQVISKVDLMAVEPWKAYQSLLLLRMFLNLVAKESVHSVLQSRFLNAVKQVCRTMELWCQDRDSTKGMLSSIGMGTRSSFDTKFRLVIRIIYTYIVVRLADKGVSVHQIVGQANSTGAGGGVLAWRKGRQSSAPNFVGEGMVSSGGRDSPSSAADARAGMTSNNKDSSAVLIETLAQLPSKNKDYAAVFITPFTSLPSGTASAGTTTAAMAMSIPVMASSMSLLPALASSPLELVKKTILSSSPPSASSAISTPPLRPTSISASLPSSSAIPSPVYTRERRRKTNSNSSIGSIGGGSIGNKRMSFQTHHSRLSMGSSWDDSTGALLMFEGKSEPNGGPSSPSSSPLGHGLLSTQRRFGKHGDTVTSSGMVAGMARFPTVKKPGDGSNDTTEHRLRLQYGTRNGVKDLEWAVQQIKDRRFRILEAAEVLTEVMERFYEGDDYFA
ncbi:Ectopic P granules protein 5 [Haplosporangium sp. Z 767]|nr:Ectopic P granules protein 5 [Haplosporangium sp. Z 767]KAF9190818.1 Ectopic P granules protein 5 [Haplosporangium sp. Z 11]